MFRATLLAFALATSANPGLAAEPLYRAVLEKPAATRLIVKDIAWSCAGGECAAPRTATVPDANACASVARRLGRLIGFEAAGRPFDTAELERCNAAVQ